MHKQMVNGMASSCRAEAADDQRETGHTHTHTHSHFPINQCLILKDFVVVQCGDDLMHYYSRVI